MMDLTPAIIVTCGLVCDMIGAAFVSIEVIRIFNGPTTIDQGDPGTLNGGSFLTPSRAFEAHEAGKRKWMMCGLFLLLSGFVLQGIGTWWPYWHSPLPTSCAPSDAHNTKTSNLLPFIYLYS